ncbi:DUF2637 domain-containing protein [Streptomyces sp. TLI_55]|uniref:DUF2637 domain-containing protein n=1 Tax=Streptomyces sp. TLI_55 TaxID=1938861 RepID=UPI00211C1C36|nr:DUF2637 domain-containing protein [Streptomyces sp. TLI_55]
MAGPRLSGTATPAAPRAHRLVIAAISAGASLIAAIGFTGSYAAVRDLAAAKGFGTFAYLFPVGIDAGICVLLALDLLLARHRIPLPLLRHTAWLLTAATISFNAATAWPDPLATGMHAVTPLLFITTIEAARHATGRLAHITADTHMDSIRTARWLLAPARTFLLWRRMKLWEQRSYTQALTLEQQRLLYQARLRSRYGRGWRHNAPIEARLPLRLTRYGIPLPHPTPAPHPTAPDDPTPLPPRPTTPPASSPTDTPHTHPHPAHSENTEPQTPDTNRAPAYPTAADHPSNTPATGPGPRQLRAFYEALNDRTGTTRAPARWARWQPDTSHTPPAGGQTPFRDRPHPPAEIPRDSTTALTSPADTSQPGQAAQPQARQHTSSVPAHPQEPVPSVTTLPATAPPDHGPRPKPTHRSPSSTPEQPAAPAPSRQPLAPSPQTAPSTHSTVHSHSTLAPAPPPRTSADGSSPTAPKEHHRPHAGDRSNSPRRTAANSRLPLTDRYYLEWMNYQAEHGAEPTPEQLSTHLAAQGFLGRGDKPITPSNLRRHLLNWRIYNLWTAHHTASTPPAPHDVAQQCATHHITGQYNRPITPQYITQHTPEFERRRHALTHHENPDTDRAQ